MGETLLMSSSPKNTLTVNMKITGKVQGVGFRYFVLRQAQELGITGWGRNKSNGDDLQRLAAPRKPCHRPRPR